MGRQKGERQSLFFPFLLPIIPCFISLPQLTPAPFRDQEMTATLLEIPVLIKRNFRIYP